MSRFVKSRCGFKVGDRVQLVNSVYSGKTGVIHKIEDDVFLSFDIKLDDETIGHGGYDCVDNTGHWYVGADELIHLRSSKNIRSKSTTSKKTSKYQCGDYVLVREDLGYGNYGGIRPTAQQFCKKGKRVRIKEVTKDGRYKIDGSIFIWTDEMFEELERELKKYFVVTVVFDSDREYCYLSDEHDIAIDSNVVVPVGSGNHETVATVKKVGWYYASEAKYDVDKMKKVIRKGTEIHPERKLKIENLRVGDVVRAIDDNYLYTSAKREWEGVVVDIYDNRFTALTTSVKSCDRRYYKFKNLIPKHFEIVKKFF